MGFWNYIRQLGEIRRLNRRINNLRSQINNAKRLVRRLRTALNNETNKRNIAFNEKERWRRIIADLKRKILIEQAKIPILQKELDELIVERDYLQSILEMGDKEHRNEISTAHKLDDKKNLTKIHNIDTKIKYYKDMQDQNELLYTSLTEKRNDLTTDELKTTHIYNNTDTYDIVHTLLFYVYYVIALLIIFIAYSNEYISNKYVLGGAIILLAVYPFYILNVELFIYDTFIYLWALFKGVPYNEQ